MPPQPTRIFMTIRGPQAHCDSGGPASRSSSQFSPSAARFASCDNLPTARMQHYPRDSGGFRPNVTVPHQLDLSRFTLSGTCSTSYGTNGLVRKHHYPGSDCSCPEMTSNATLRRSLAPADLLLSPSLPSFCGQSTAERTRQYSIVRTAALVDQRREAWNTPR